jgi:hypothetical protein
MTKWGFGVMSVVLLTVFSGCENAVKDPGGNGSSPDTILGPTSGAVDETMIDLLMGLPSPVEMVNLLRNANAAYDGTLLNPIVNKENYKTSSSQALNLGIYGADLSYVTLFDRKKESLQYFALTSEIAQKIGVGSVFTKDVLDRATNNQGNRDSLEQIFTETFANLHSKLEQNSNERDLALIITGGWVETIWLAGSIWKVKKVPELAEQIASQFQTAHTLADMIGKIDSRDKLVENVKNQMSQIAKIYAGMVPALKQNDTLKTNENKSEAGGKDPEEEAPVKPVYTDKEIEAIYNLTAAVRKSIIEG